MAKIHILRGTGDNRYQAIIHSPVPAGANTAGVAWSAALVAAGLNTSVLTVGTGPGQTTQAEMDEILAGTVMEVSAVWESNPAWSAAQRNADLDQRATQAVAEAQSNLAAQLRLYGATRA